MSFSSLSAPIAEKISSDSTNTSLSKSFVSYDLPENIQGLKRVYSVGVGTTNKSYSSRSGKTIVSTQKEFTSGAYINLTSRELIALGINPTVYAINKTGFWYKGNYFESLVVPSYADSIEIELIDTVRLSNIRITNPQGGNFRSWPNPKLEYLYDGSTNILDTMIEEFTFLQLIEKLEKENVDWTFTGFYIEGTDSLITIVDDGLTNVRLETRWAKKNAHMVISSLEITIPGKGGTYSNNYYSNIFLKIDDFLEDDILSLTLPSNYKVSYVIKEINRDYPEWKFVGFGDVFTGEIYNHIDSSIMGKTLVTRWEQTQRTILVHYVDEQGKAVLDDYNKEVKPDSLIILKNSFFSTSTLVKKTFPNYYYLNKFYEDSSFEQSINLIDWETDVIYVKYQSKAVKISVNRNGSTISKTIPTTSGESPSESIDENLSNNNTISLVGYSINERPKSLSEIMTFPQAKQYMQEITDSTREVTFYEQFKYNSSSLIDEKSNACYHQTIFYKNLGLADYSVSIAADLNNNAKFLNYIYLDLNLYTVDFSTKLIRSTDTDEKREFERRMSNVFQSKDKVSKIGGIVTGIQKTTSEEINKLLGKGYIELQTSKSSWAYNSFYIASESLEVSNLNFVFKWNTYGNYMDGSYRYELLSISYRPGYSPQHISIQNQRTEYYSTAVAKLDLSTVLKEYFR